MQLIGSLTSPFVRKIRIALIEKNLAFELIVDLPTNPGSKVADFNPLGKVPVLIDDDGAIWFDSDLVLEYLETLYPDVPLLPQERRAALPVRQTMKLADGVADAGVLIYLEKLREADKQDEKWIARQRGKVDRGLAALEVRATDKTWLHGDAFGAADIAVGCYLCWLDFRLPDLKWRDRYPALVALDARLSERPSFAQTVPVI